MGMTDHSQAKPAPFRRALLLGGAALLSASGWASLAHGQATTQTANADLELGSEEIIVTARRQSEALIDVPASVAVFTKQALEQTGIKTASDFVKLTAGVTIVTGTAEAGDTQINIRGLNGARDAENNVALVVDGVLKTNVASLNQDQGALEQIEVLKGPQGAIYGRNAAAGAIVITTAKPGKDLAFTTKATYANERTATVSALFSGPIADGVGFVLNGDFARSDGFFRNTFLPSAVNRSTYPGNSTRSAVLDNYDRWNINGRLVFDLGESTNIDVKGRYGQLHGGSIVFNALFQIPNLFDISPTVSSNIDVNDHVFRFDQNIDPNNDQTTGEASVRLSTDVGIGTLTGYVAYSNIKNDFYADGTSGAFGFFAAEPTCIRSTAATAGVQVQEPFQTVGAFRGSQPYSPTSCDGTQYQRRNQEDVSVELRLASKGGGAFDWQFGGYYLHIDRRVCINLGLDTGQGVVQQCFTTDPTNPTEGLSDDNYRTNVYAGFGNVDYEVLDGLKLGVALRYDVEQREVSNNVPTGRRTRWVGNVLTGNPNGTAATPANYYLNPGLDPVYNPSGVLGARNRTFRQFQPKISLTYKPLDTLTLFTNWGIGFKSGGFNASGSSAIVNGFFNNGTAIFVPGNPINSGLSISDDYDKERTSAFEAGLKGSVFDRRVALELAGYYTKVRNQQFFEFFVGPFGLLRVVSNIDRVQLYGVEGSANIRIVKGVSIFGSANYTKSEIKENRSRPYTVGNDAPYTSKYTINAGAQVILPITDSIDFTGRLDWRLTGPTYFHTVQNNNAPNIFFGDNILEGNFSNSRRDPYNIVNLRVGFQAKNWTLAFVGNNITNTKYLAEVIPAVEFGGDFVSPGARQSYGVEVGFRF